MLDQLRKPGRARVVAFLCALVPVLLICLVATPVYPMSPDEQVQQLFASGRFLAQGGGCLMPYSLVVVSAPLAALYAACPQVPWYALLLLGLVVVAFWVAWVHVLRSRMGASARVVSLGALLALEAICTLYLSYTIAAFLACAAGLMLVLDHAAFEPVRGVCPADVAGVALVALGYSLRPESGLATIAIFAPFALWVLVRNRSLASVLRGIAVLALVGLCAFAGRYAYDHTPGWEGYAAYLDAGRSVLDYPDMTAEQVRQLAPELTDNDVAMLQNWLFADDSVFGTELFERLEPGADHLGLSNIEDSLHAKTTYLLVGLVALAGGFAWLVHHGAAGERAGVGALAAGVVLMLLVSCGVLVLRARVRLHVVIPLVAAAVLALVSTVERVGEGQAVPAGAPVARWVVVASVLVPLALCGAFYAKVVRPIAQRGSSPTVAASRAYVAEHPDELVVFGRSQTIMFAGQDLFELEGWEYPANMLQVGGWENHTAAWACALERWGIEGNDVLQQLPERANMVAVLQPKKMELIRTYLSEHSGREVTATVVEDLGPGAADPSSDVIVYRFAYAS